MEDRAVPKVALLVVPGHSPLQEMQHMPNEIFFWQIQVRHLNNGSQINWSTVVSVYTKEFDSTMMLVLRVWERRKDGMWIIFYTVLVEIVVLMMFQCKLKSIL